jgi:hypothetical protein
MCVGRLVGQRIGIFCQARNPLYCVDMSRQSGRGLLTTVLGFAGGAAVAASLLVEPPLGLLLFVVMAGLLVWRHPPLTTAVAIAIGAAAVLFAIGLSNLGNSNGDGRTPGPWLLASAAFVAVAAIGAWIPHVRRRLRG